MPVPPLMLDPDDERRPARAYRVAGSAGDAQRHLALGYAAADKVTGEEERELLRSDLADVAGSPIGG